MLAMITASTVGCDRFDLHRPLASSERFAPIIPATPAPVAPGRTLWVDVDSRGGVCSDERWREDVTKNRPWCTLARAGQRAKAGDTVRVRGGDYTTMATCTRCTASAVLEVRTTGTADAWIRFLAEPGEPVRIRPGGEAKQGISIGVPKSEREKEGRAASEGSEPAVDAGDLPELVAPRFIEIAGFEVSGAANNCVEVKRTSDVVLRDLDVSRCGSGAIEMHQTERVALLSSRIHDNRLAGWTSAVDLFLCGEGHVVRGNRIWSNRDADERRSEGHGITMDFCKQAGGALIENNLIWDNDGWCMAIFVSDGAVIRNNTCWMNGRKLDGSGEISLLGSRHFVVDNVLVPSADAPALSIRDRNSDWSSDWSLVHEDHNLLWAPTHEKMIVWGRSRPATVAEYRARNARGWGQHSVQLDPRLVDPGHADFRLLDGSPAIDAGDTHHGAVEDVASSVRPLDGNGDGQAVTDMGAYEHAALRADGATGR